MDSLEWNRNNRSGTQHMIAVVAKSAILSTHQPCPRQGPQTCRVRPEVSFPKVGGCTSSSQLCWRSGLLHVSSGNHCRSDPVRVQSTRKLISIPCASRSIEAVRLTPFRFAACLGLLLLAIVFALMWAEWKVSVTCFFMDYPSVSDWIPWQKNCVHFSICACHPCAGAMLIFSVSFPF